VGGDEVTELDDPQVRSVIDVAILDYWREQAAKGRFAPIWTEGQAILAALRASGYSIVRDDEAPQ
jgi:hypothetical protein